MQNYYKYSFDDVEGNIHFSGSSPKLVVWMKDGNVTINSPDGIREYPGGPTGGLAMLEEIWRDFSSQNQDLINSSPDLPFVGGGVGFFSYDFCKVFETVPKIAIDDISLPDWCFAFYDGSKKSEWSPPGLPIKRIESKPPLSPTSNLSKREYIDKILKIKEYIRDGDVYQVNFAQRFSVKTSTPPFDLYRKLQSLSPVPYASYLDFGSVQIISHSPELFLKKDSASNLIFTEPIKGTRPRGQEKKEDERLRSELSRSEKDRAELTMIVDLERNDLSKICKPGSVKVDELYKIKSFPSVHHLVSNIHGELLPDSSIIQVIKSMFPGGSITGAPKVRAMELIEELEPNSRGVYTGSIGYLDIRGSFQFNIAIRTILIADETAFFHLGGGIVADSDPESEYLETMHKGSPFWQLFGAVENR